jgi:hypothetical protein
VPATARVDRLSPADIETRRPVWSALSDMFLDTSLIPADIARIAGTLAASPYSLEELDEILVREVYPACFTNLISIAGEWGGFAPDWLEARIRRGPSWSRWMWSAIFARWGTWRSWDWRKIRRAVQALRDR